MVYCNELNAYDTIELLKSRKKCIDDVLDARCTMVGRKWKLCTYFLKYYIVELYSVSHIITYPSKELCSKMALGEVGVSLP